MECSYHSGINLRIKSLNEDIKRIIKDEGPLPEEDYHLTIKPTLSTLGSIREVTPGQGY